jgi:hypothetical protein
MHEQIFYELYWICQCLVGVVVSVGFSIGAGMAMFGRLQRAVVVMRGSSHSVKIKVGSFEAIDLVLLLFVPSSSNSCLFDPTIRQFDYFFDVSPCGAKYTRTNCKAICPFLFINFLPESSILTRPPKKYIHFFGCERYAAEQYKEYWSVHTGVQLYSRSTA